MKIVFLEPLGLKVQQIETACEGLKKARHEVVVYPDRNENLDELIHRADGADVVIESNIPLRKDFLDACPNLKMLSIAFTGLDHIDMEECQRRGIVVNNAAGYSTEAVAELAIAMMIDVYRKVLENDAITRQCNRKGIMPGREIGARPWASSAWATSGNVWPSWRMLLAARCWHGTAHLNKLKV